MTALLAALVAASSARGAVPQRNYPLWQARQDWEREAWARYPQPPPSWGSGLRDWWDTCKTELCYQQRAVARKAYIEARHSDWHLSVAQHVAFAENFNGASSPEELEQYLDMFLYQDEESVSLDGHICRIHLPEKAKGQPLYVLLLGTGQTLNGDSEDEGPHIFRQWLKQADKPVITCESGSLNDDFKNYTTLNGKYATEMEVIRQHVYNILKLVLAKHQPSEVRMLGFSRGGNIINWLSRYQGWRTADVRVTRTVSIDPVTMKNRQAGWPDRDRPNFWNAEEQRPHNRHLQIYQQHNIAEAQGIGDVIRTIGRNVYAIQGAPCNEFWPGDQSERAYVGHLKMDKDPRNVDLAWKHLMGE